MSLSQVLCAQARHSRQDKDCLEVSNLRANHSNRRRFTATWIDPLLLLHSLLFLFHNTSKEVEVVFPNGKKTKAATGAKLKDVASKAGYKPNYGCEVR